MDFDKKSQGSTEKPPVASHQFQTPSVDLSQFPAQSKALAARERSWIESLVALLTASAARIQSEYKDQRTLWLLKSMNDHTLQDIGLSRRDVFSVSEQMHKSDGWLERRTEEQMRVH
jgi:uncharacterized protein YjiS (DUF1127 family)